VDLAFAGCLQERAEEIIERHTGGNAVGELIAGGEDAEQHAGAAHAGEDAGIEDVVVAEPGVPRDREPGRVDRVAGGGEETGQRGIAPGALPGIVTESTQSGVRVPEGGVDGFRHGAVVVLQADIMTAGRVEAGAPAIEDGQHHFQFMRAAVVGAVTGGDREIEWATGDGPGGERVDAANHRIEDVDAEGILSPKSVREIGAVELPWILPEEGRVRGRRGVDNMEVGELGEGRERRAGRRTVRIGGGEILAHDDRPSGFGADPAVGVTRGPIVRRRDGARQRRHARDGLCPGWWSRRSAWVCCRAEGVAGREPGSAGCLQESTAREIAPGRGSAGVAHRVLLRECRSWS